MSSTIWLAVPELFVGGPDRPPRALRDLLQSHVDAAPAGSSIHWATYYFRDRALARALIAAHRRGVRVTLHLEGSPRRAGTNDRVIDLFERDGLGDGLHIHRAEGVAAALHPHLHTKIYAFDGPEAVALVGSFNPSGDDPEDAGVIAEIGDQDRGHNMLVAYREPAIVQALARQVERINGASDRFYPGRTQHLGATTLYFYPRLRTGIVDRELANISRGCRIRGAISHLKKGPLARALRACARRGAQVELLVHDTERRVPQALVTELAAAGIAITRFAHPDGLPMHAKFLLIQRGDERTAWFGSFNFNPRSRFLNHELLVRSSDGQLFGALDRRFDEIAAIIA
jgi:hypothetical protein